MASILAPVLYLAIILGGLLVFSYVYRKRLAAKRPEPWFPSHPERDTYVTLLQQTEPKASDALLKAALIRRAMADVVRFTRIRDDKTALQTLLQKGSIGDELWNSFLTAEKEMQAEILEVMHEANSFVQGWGQIIFTSAGEMVNNEKMKALFDGIPKAKIAAEAKFAAKPRKPAPVPEKSDPIAAPSSAVTKDTPAPAEPPAAPAASPDAATNTTNGQTTVPAQAAAAADDSISSDGELVSVPTTPPPVKAAVTPSKASGKKGKKRK